MKTIAILMTCMLFTLSGCKGQTAPAVEAKESTSMQSEARNTKVVNETSETAEQAVEGETAVSADTVTAHETEETEMILQMRIDDTNVTVDWEQNESVEALKTLCQDRPLTIRMSMYGGFEQVGAIGQSLPRKDSQTTTEAGDIVLYSGDQIVVFYGSNSWAYTRLGHISLFSTGQIPGLIPGSDISGTSPRRKWRNCSAMAM